MKPPSMIGRLMFSVTAMVVLFWIGAAVGGIVVMHDELAEIFDSSLQETTERLAPLIVDDIARRELTQSAISLEIPNSSSRQYLTYQAKDSAGQVLLHSSKTNSEPFPAPLVQGFWEDDIARYFTVAAQDGAIFIQVADQLKNRREAINESALALLLPVLVLIPLSLYLIRMVARHAVKPVGNLREAIAQKDSGDLTPVEIDNLAFELQPIVHSVNLLMRRVRSTLDAERTFTSNSAHELRTPIAGALAHVQLLKNEVKSKTTRSRVEQIEDSLQKLMHLVEKLMQLARAEANIAISETPYDLLRVLDIIVEDFRRSDLSSHRLTYERDASSSLVKMINEDMFAIVMRNLIENALLHGAQDQPVRVLVGSDATIQVINGGATLTIDELNAVQQRFGRGRTPSAGSGLGLPIVIEITNQMRANLRLSSPADGQKDGFLAELSFPPAL